MSKKRHLLCVNLAYNLPEQPLFDQINIELESGELLVIRGGNGSGKSTFLRLIAGILSPSHGEILLDGSSINDIEHYGRKVLLVGHQHTLVPHLTPFDMLNFWTKIYGNAELLDAAIEYFDLSPHLDTPCHQLSEGWKQRLSLARLILSPAGLWLLDEPASHLDNAGVALLNSLITARRQQGGIVLIAMHGDIDSDNIKKLDLS